MALVYWVTFTYGYDFLCKTMRWFPSLNSFVAKLNIPAIQFYNFIIFILANVSLGWPSSIWPNNSILTEPPPWLANTAGKMINLDMYIFPLNPLYKFAASLIIPFGDYHPKGLYMELYFGIYYCLHNCLKLLVNYKTVQFTVYFYCHNLLLGCY
jgi:hypothetical protein